MPTLVPNFKRIRSLANSINFDADFDHAALTDEGDLVFTLDQIKKIQVHIHKIIDEIDIIHTTLRREIRNA